MNSEITNKPFHKGCFACGDQNESGLKIKFAFENEKVRGILESQERFQSYDGILHGGVIANILDSAMVNLFHKKYGIEVKTVKLNIKYRKPVKTGLLFEVTAWERPKRHFLIAKAEISCEGKALVTADAWFL